MTNEVNVSENEAWLAAAITRKHMNSAMDRFFYLFGLPHCCKDGVGAAAVDMEKVRALYFELLAPCTLGELQQVVAAWSRNGRHYPYVADLLDELAKLRRGPCEQACHDV